MSGIVIVMLIYHRHEPIDSTNRNRTRKVRKRLFKANFARFTVLNIIHLKSARLYRNCFNTSIYSYLYVHYFWGNIKWKCLRNINNHFFLNLLLRCSAFIFRRKKASINILWCGNLLSEIGRNKPEGQNLWGYGLDLSLVQ
jgi:hypothetical protein